VFRCFFGFLDGLREYAHAFLYGLLIPDGDFPDGLDAFLHKLRIEFVDVFLELVEHGLIVFEVDDACQYFYLLVFDVVGIGELAEEAFDFVLEDEWTFLDDVLDVFEHHPLGFDGGEGDHRDDRGGQFLY
jgi:hypothetical protein